MEGTKDKLQKLVENHAGMEKLKASVVALGTDLIRSDPNSSSEFTPLLKSVSDNYDRLQGAMTSKWEGLVDGVHLWKKYGEAKEAAQALLREGDKLASPVLTQVPSNSAEASSLLEALKRAADLLNKKKIVVENCGALNQQLCSCLGPLTDTASLGQEMAGIKVRTVY